MINQEPIRLGNGDVWYLHRDESGYYCPVCASGPSVEAPYEDLGEDGVGPSYSLCSSCHVEYDSPDPEGGVAEFEEQWRILRITWLCRTGWQEHSLQRLQDILGLSRETISEYEFLAGREQKLDERFRPMQSQTTKRNRSEPHYKTRCLACPCCGHLGAICYIFSPCGFCAWKYAPQQEIHFTDRSGPNPISLLEAQQNYTLFGAITEEIAKIIHKPEYDLGIDPTWRPLTP